MAPKRLDPPRRFALSFGAITLALFALYCFPYAEVGLSEHWFGAYLSAYARLTGYVLRIVEPGIEVLDNTILGKASLRIVKTCDAMEANILFASALLAFPGQLSRKLVALGSGLAVLGAVNVLRIGTLYCVIVYLPASFDLFHLEIWPVLMIGSTLALFLTCASWLRRNAEATA